MAKNTKKENALAMFSNTNTVKPKESKPIVAEKITPPKKTPQKAVAKPKPEPPVEKEEAVIAESVIEPSNGIAIEPEAVTIQDVRTPKINLTMAPKPARSGHAKTLYLSYEIEEKLKQGAEKNNCSVSEYLNFILAQVL